MTLLVNIGGDFFLGLFYAGWLKWTFKGIYLVGRILQLICFMFFDFGCPSLSVSSSFAHTRLKRQTMQYQTVWIYLFEKY